MGVMLRVMAGFRLHEAPRTVTAHSHEKQLLRESFEPYFGGRYGRRFFFHHFSEASSSAEITQKGSQHSTSSRGFLGLLLFWHSTFLLRCVRRALHCEKSLAVLFIPFGDRSWIPRGMISTRALLDDKNGVPCYYFRQLLGVPERHSTPEDPGTPITVEIRSQRIPPIERILFDCMCVRILRVQLQEFSWTFADDRILGHNRRELPAARGMQDENANASSP